VVALSWDKKRLRPKLTLEPWWDGDKGVFIIYDDNDEMEMAVKEWTVGANTRRRNVWVEGFVQRYKSTDNGATWSRTQLQSDTAWPQPWVHGKTGEPLAIPYVHFPNATKEFIHHGVSDLSGGVLGFQDQLNDAQFSMSACARLTAYQMYWGTGVKPKKDRNGNDVPPQVAPGNMFTSPDPAAKFGTLPAGSMEQQIKGYDKKLQRVAQMTATPIHTITGGDWPSGDALIRAELPAVGKAHKQVAQFNVCWTQIGHRVTELQNSFGDGPELNMDPETALITCVFSDVEKRDIVSRSIIVHNMAANISKAEALRILQYPEDKVQQIVKEILEETAALAAMTQAKLEQERAKNKPVAEKGKDPQKT
jgi:hypothetical protein